MKKTGRQRSEELIAVIEALRRKGALQSRMVLKFQKLIRSEGLSSPVINNFPYPLAVFEHDGELVLVNNALSNETGLQCPDLANQQHSLFNRITDANYAILDAVEHVFMGKTTFLSGLSDPLAIFVGEKWRRKKSSFKYRAAVFFPVSQNEGLATLGGVIFMK